MHTRTAATTSPTTAARRRRHLSVYHRALRSAATAEQRAEVAARYRHLFALEAASKPELTLASSQDSAAISAEVENLTVTVAA